MLEELESVTDDERVFAFLENKRNTRLMESQPEDYSKLLEDYEAAKENLKKSEEKLERNEKTMQKKLSQL